MKHGIVAAVSALRFSAAAVVLLSAVGCAARQVPFPEAPRPGSVYHSLQKPDGAGPFPAVVLLHTCGGLQQHVLEWSVRFRDHGYVAVVLDSFTPRGEKSVCGNWRVSLDEVAADAYAALAHLRTRPYVDAQRIGVMGFSYGAMATLRLTSASYRGSGHPRATNFGAAVALYPYCTDSRAGLPPDARERLNNLHDDVDTPLLILLAGLDDQAPPQGCAEKAEALGRAGRPVSFKLYPGAPHAFDMTNMGTEGRRDARGNYYRYDPVVTADAVKISFDFLDRNLAGRPNR
jgi:dienelactone hydrolase